MRLARFTTCVFAAAIMSGCSSVQYVKSELSGTAKPEGGIGESIAPLKTYSASQEAIRRATLAVLEEQGYVVEENVAAGTVKTDPKPLGDVTKFQFTGATYYAKLAIKFEGPNVTYRAKFDKKSSLTQGETNIDFPEKENELRRDFFLALDKKLLKSSPSVQTTAQQSAPAQVKELPKSEPRQTEAAQTVQTTMSVSELQKILVELGYPIGAVDGVAGKRTVDALKNFQSMNKLAASGTLDPETVSLLRNARKGN